MDESMIQLYGANKLNILTKLKDMLFYTIL